MLKKCDFEKQRCQVGETKYIEEKSDLVEMEDVTLVNNVTLYERSQARCDSVEKYRAQRTTCCLAVTRNTTQQVHNAKHCTLEHCVGLYISQQVVYIGDRSSYLQ